MIQDLTLWLATNPGWLSAAVFATALLESLAVAGILVPGVAILFAIAVLAGQTGTPVLYILVWGAAGAIVGDLLSFWLGQRLRGRLHQVWPFRRHPVMVRRAESLFVRHGGKSVVIGRFVGPVRPFIPMVAGAFNMPARRFVLVNIASALAWAPCYLLPGFAVGAALAGPEPIPPALYGLGAGAAGVLLLAWFLFVRMQLGLRNRSRLYQWLEQSMARYNATHRFWRALYSERPAQGGEFPLASLCLALGASGGFVLWSLFSQATGLLLSLDHYFRDLTDTLRSPLTDPVFLLLTLAGDPPVLVVGSVLMASALFLRGYYSAAAHLVAALLLTSVSVTLLKNGFAIARPTLVTEPPASFAFPSGHAAGITVFTGMAAAFVAREWRPARRWRIYLVFSVPMVLVAVSRVALGVHWFTDVVGGLLLGLAICGLVRASYSRYDRTPLSADSFTGLAVVLWAAFLGSYIWWQWSPARLVYSFPG